MLEISLTMAAFKSQIAFPDMCHFLLRLLKGTMRQRDYRMALRAFTETFRLHPGAVHKIPKWICRALWRVFLNIFRKFLFTAKKLFNDS